MTMPAFHLPFWLLWFGYSVFWLVVIEQFRILQRELQGAA